MGNEHAEPNDRRVIAIFFGILAAVIVVGIIVTVIVNGVQQRERDAQLDRMVNDRLNSCFDTGDC